jgi:hypothetical protein
MHVLPIYCGQAAFAATLALKARSAARPVTSEVSSTKTRYRRSGHGIRAICTGLFGRARSHVE